MRTNIRSIAASASVAALLLSATASRASIAWGSINNFDTVNDTGHECHGFEIELEDCHSTDITYTYNYNHYGTPKITQDDSVAGHPRCIIRWESAKKADGSWASYTAIPSGTVNPTDGHQFTNPNVNFGGEHFGVGYYNQPSAIRYNWLIDNGSGALVHGGAVQVATPAFTYYPPVGNAPAQVVAAIEPPEPPEIHPLEFGEAVWVKEIRTTTKNRRKVKLRDLVSDDPDDPDDVNWRNGEPDEVEVEWQLLQTEFKKADGGNNGVLEAAPEDLDHGDEVVTRRYEFFKYTGPLDPESGEAVCENVGPDDIHGEGIAEVDGEDVDMATVEVVGEYTGAQMAAVDVAAGVGLTEQLGDGNVGEAYAARSVVIQGAAPFTASLTGAVPAGMNLDTTTGILSGTPAEAGTYKFTVQASDAVTPAQEKSYTVVIAPAGADAAPHYVIDAAPQPVAGGTTSGSNAFAPGESAILTAAPSPGYRFVRWEEAGEVLGNDPLLTVIMDINHSVVARFEPSVPVLIAPSTWAGGGGAVSGGGTIPTGSEATLTATPAAGFEFVNWSSSGTVLSESATYTFTATAAVSVTAMFRPVLTFDNQAATTHLSWPANAPGWQLQESSDPGGPWQPYSGGVTIVGDSSEASPPLTSQRRFFRLQRP